MNNSDSSVNIYELAFPNIVLFRGLGWELPVIRPFAQGSKVEGKKYAL